MQGFFNAIGCWTRHTRTAEMQEGLASAFHSAKDLKCDNKSFCCMFPSFTTCLLDVLNLLLKRRGPSRNVKPSEGRAVNFNVTFESNCSRPSIACVCLSLTHHSYKVKSLFLAAPAMAHQIWHFALHSQIHVDVHAQKTDQQNSRHLEATKQTFGQIGKTGSTLATPMGPSFLTSKDFIEEFLSTGIARGRLADEFVEQKPFHSWFIWRQSFTKEIIGWLLSSKLSRAGLSRRGAATV